MRRKALVNFGKTGKISGRRGKNIPPEIILGYLRRRHEGVASIELGVVSYFGDIYFALWYLDLVKRPTLMA